MKEDIFFRYKKEKESIINGKNVLLFNNDTNRWIIIPKENMDIIDKIVEENICLNELTKYFSRKEDYDYIVKLLNKLYEIELLQYSDENQKVEKYSDLSFIITKQCNLSCIHCCENAVKDNNEKELSASEWKQVIDIIYSIPFKSVTITGGEPLVRKEIQEICEYLREKFKGKILLLTNGLLIDESNIEWIINVFDYISISLDGNNYELTELIRGKGVFEKVIKNIKLLQNKGFSEISLSALLPNSYEIKEEFIDLCKQLRVRPLLRYLALYGRGALNEKYIKREYEQYIKRKGYHMYNEITSEEKANPGTCGACKSKFSIDYMGNIYPCNILRKEKYCIGNILLDKNILNNFNTKIAYKNVEKIKKFTLNNCKDCPVNCFCWSCPAEYEQILENRELFNYRCDIRRKKLMKEIWNIKE